MAQNIRYYNQSAPFWDMISQIESATTQHPFFNAYAAVPTDEKDERAPNYDEDIPQPPDYDDEKPNPDGPNPPPAPGHHGELPHHHGPPHHGPHHDRHEGPPGCGRRGGHKRGGFGGWGRGGPGGCGRGGFGDFGGRRGHGFPFGRGWGREGGAPGWANMMGAGAPQMEAFKAFMSQFAPSGDQSDEDKTFTPPCDVFDMPAAFVLHFSLPGAKKEDVGVNWDADKSELSVAGVVYRPGDEELIKALAMDEREVGVFERKVRLGSRANPAQVDSDGITAKMDDGVLVVTVPKVEEFVEIKKVDVE